MPISKLDEQTPIIEIIHAIGHVHEDGEKQEYYFLPVVFKKDYNGNWTILEFKEAPDYVRRSANKNFY